VRSDNVVGMVGTSRTSAAAKIFSDVDLNKAVNKNGFLRLNHFGSIEKINAIGFVDLMQRFKEKPDSLDFNGKLVLIAVSAAGIANFKSTPLNAVFPSSLVHLTVAENIIFQNYLIDMSSYFKLLILMLMIVGAWFLAKLTKTNVILAPLALIIIYWVVAMLFFSLLNVILPLFYPTIAVIATVSVNQILTLKEKQRMEISIRNMLQKQIQSKGEQLQHTKEKLNQLDVQLKQEYVSKAEIQKQAEENKKVDAALFS